MAGVLRYYAEALMDVVLARLGFTAPPAEEAPQPKKKRKSNMSPEAREAAGQRMRDMQARKKAERAAA